MFCRKCGYQMSEGAAFCEKCGTKVSEENSKRPTYEQKPVICEKTESLAKIPKPIYKRVWFWVAIVFAILVLNLMLGDDGATSSGSGRQSKALTSSSKTLSATIEKIEILEPNGILEPSDGNEFVGLTVLIKNLSDEYTVLLLPSFNIYADGMPLDISLFAAALVDYSQLEPLDGEYSGGQQKRGILAYEVPKGWKEIVFEVDMNPFVRHGADENLRIIVTPKSVK